MNALTRILAKSGLLTKDLDYHLLRAAMVLILLAFGYQKWFAYEAQILIPYISNGPLIFGLYPVFGLLGASWLLGVSEWTFGALLFLGFWNKQLGILGAIGSTLTFIGDGHHHSIRAERLGPGCGISGDGGHGALPNEGCRSFGRLDLLAQAGRRAHD